MVVQKAVVSVGGVGARRGGGQGLVVGVMGRMGGRMAVGECLGLCRRTSGPDYWGGNL